jgi:hypothetical protein
MDHFAIDVHEKGSQICSLAEGGELNGHFEAVERAALGRSYQSVDQEERAFLLVPRDGVAPEAIGSIAEKLHALRGRRPLPFVDSKVIKTSFIRRQGRSRRVSPPGRWACTKAPSHCAARSTAQPVQASLP